MLNQTLLEFARNHFGVIDRRQLQNEEITRSQLSRARHKGLIENITSRTIRLTSTPDSFLLRCQAVDLHLEEQGVLTGVTAGRLLGLRSMGDVPIRVAIADGHRVRLPSWVDVHVTNWFEPDRDRFHIANGLAVAEPHMMLWALAARFSQKAFERAAEDCWHLGLVSPKSATAYLAAHRRSGKNGVRRIEVWLEHVAGQERPAQSGLEQQLLDALRAAGLPTPTRQHPLDLASGQRIHVDIAWPSIQLCVEPGHSWWHGGNEAATRDLERRLGAAALGWDTIQLDESLRLDPARAADQIRMAFHARRRLLSRSPTSLTRSA